jgi:transposase
MLAEPSMPIPIAPHPFRPLTDDEFALLSRWLPAIEGRPGRPPADRRRTLDAIFWVACSRGPWKDLPAGLGRADTASRTLRRWAKAGHLDLLLHQAATATRARADRPWRDLAWRICRAWRRVARVVSLQQLLLAKRLGQQEALPAAPHFLPDPDLSKAIQSQVHHALETVRDQPLGLFPRLGRLLVVAGGRMRYWRLR